MTPIVYTTTEDSSFLQNMASYIEKEVQDSSASYLLDYPIVYIHFWPKKSFVYVDSQGREISKRGFNVYVGESNDVVRRTKKHYEDGQKTDNWVKHLHDDNACAKIIIIGHSHFNKSFTLDLENRLIDYIAPGYDIQLFNARGNPQNEYYPIEEFEQVFQSIWRKLRKINKDLFPSLSEIEKTAFFKASPLKKLTPDQLEAKEDIIARVYDALENQKEGQLVFVQGEAGTGKTVLNSALFYELSTQGKELFGKDIDCHLMVNHDQQYNVYRQIAKRLCIGEEKVHKPTSFINKYSESNKVDVAFIDEAHLLLTQGKQSYTGRNQLDDIIKRARVTVVMFDEFQVLTAEEYWEPAVLDRFKELAYRQNNMLELKKQLRMQCSESTQKWIRFFVEFKTLLPFIPDPDYDVQVFDSPQALHAAIKERAKTDSLSRVVASYDWPYNNMREPEDAEYWSVRIGDWSLPWNYQTEKRLSSKEKRANSSKAWAEQDQTIDEVGSTFTIQGFDLSYVGVILGPSVKYRDGEIIFDPSESKNNKAVQRRTLNDGTKMSLGDTFICHEVKVLLTRGVKGLYIYACDDKLREALHRSITPHL